MTTQCTNICPSNTKIRLFWFLHRTLTHCWSKWTNSFSHCTDSFVVSDVTLEEKFHFGHQRRSHGFNGCTLSCHEQANDWVSIGVAECLSKCEWISDVLVKRSYRFLPWWNDIVPQNFVMIWLTGFAKRDIVPQLHLASSRVPLTFLRLPPCWQLLAWPWQGTYTCSDP